MSSDYLCYELSAELKRLGVEFKTSFGYLPEKKTGYLFVANNELFFYRFFGKRVGSISNYNDVIAAPSTAQLIDEIAKRMKPHETKAKLVMSGKGLNFILAFKYTEKFQGFDSVDPCCTTALGKALIELVKGEKDE